MPKLDALDAEIGAVMLRSHDVRVLNSARTILSELRDNARARAWHADRHDDASPQNLGYLAAYATVAENAIFDALNAARSYCAEPISDDLIHNRKK